MARDRTVHVCSACGAQSTKWQGQCPGCNEWNTMIETVVSSHPAAAGARPAPGAAGTIAYELLCALAPRVPVREQAAGEGSLPGAEAD